MIEDLLTKLIEALNANTAAHTGTAAPTAAPKKSKLAGDPEAVKAAWTAVQKGFGIARVAELRNDPAKLLDALAKAKAL